MSGRAAVIVLGCLVCQLGAGFFYATRVLAPDVIGELGWTRAMWSSAMAPMLLVSSLAQAVIGTLCVRFGVRPVVLVSLSAMLGCFAVLSAMTTLWHFYVAMMLLAVGNAGIGDVVVSSVITQWFRRGRSLALGIALTGSNLGGVVFVQAIAALSAGGSWRSAALSIGIGGVAVIVPFALFAMREPRSGEGAGLEADSPSSGPATALFDVPSLSLAQALRVPAFWVLVYVLFCYSFSQLGMADHLILYLADLGYEATEAGSYLGLTLGAGIASKLGAGLLALRWSARSVLIVNTAMLTASFALVPFARDRELLAAFGILFGVATAARDVLFPLLIAQLFGTRTLAQLYGAIMLAFVPGGVLGPLMLAWTSDALGGYEAGFILCIALDAVALLGLLAVGGRRNTG